MECVVVVGGRDETSPFYKKIFDSNFARKYLPNLFPAIQVRSPPKKLAVWKKHTKAHRLDFYIGSKRLLHMRNWLIKVCMPTNILSTECKKRSEESCNCKPAYALVNGLVIPKVNMLRCAKF